MNTEPPKIPLPFAASAAAPYINTIPLASQIGITNGAASFTDGFPPNTFISLSSGGAGPFGRDFNGLLNQITAGLQWKQAGGRELWDSTFSTNIGGYPQGAMLHLGNGAVGSFWYSLTNNNTSNPDMGGANWVLLRAPSNGVPLETQYGGTGLASLAQHYILVGEGTANVGGINPGATVGLPLLSGGTGADPSFGQLNLAASTTVGKLPVTQAPAQVLLFDVTAGTRNFTVPANTFFICPMIVAGGGGGAALNASHGGGGGGAGGNAGYPGLDWIAVTPGQVISYTVGAGGAGGTGGDGTTGAPGSFGPYLSVSGGLNGASQASSGGGLGGTGATTGFVVQFIAGDGTDGDSSGSNNFAGNGGASVFGGGSRGSVGSTITGQRALGSGGGGTYRNAGAGLPGQVGCVIVWG